MFFTKRCPLGGTEYVSFELFLGILKGPGEGRGGAPGTVPLQNPEVISRKACLRSVDVCAYLRLLAFARVCLRFETHLRESEICICLRLLAFVLVRNTSFYNTPFGSTLKIRDL